MAVEDNHRRPQPEREGLGARSLLRESVEPHVETSGSRWYRSG